MPGCTCARALTCTYTCKLRVVTAVNENGQQGDARRGEWQVAASQGGRRSAGAPTPAALPRSPRATAPRHARLVASVRALAAAGTALTVRTAAQLRSGAAFFARFPLAGLPGSGASTRHQHHRTNHRSHTTGSAAWTAIARREQRWRRVQKRCVLLQALAAVAAWQTTPLCTHAIAHRLQLRDAAAAARSAAQAPAQGRQQRGARARHRGAAAGASCRDAAASGGGGAAAGPDRRPAAGCCRCPQRVNAYNSQGA